MGGEKTMEIKVLGSGCRKCVNLYESVGTAVAEAGVEANIEKVSDMMRIASFGVMSTPALVVDGQVLSSGRVPSKDEIVKMLRARAGR